MSEYIAENSKRNIRVAEALIEAGLQVTAFEAVAGGDHYTIAAVPGRSDRLMVWKTDAEGEPRMMESTHLHGQWSTAEVIAILQRANNAPMPRAAKK